MPFNKANHSKETEISGKHGAPCHFGLTAAFGQAIMAVWLQLSSQTTLLPAPHHPPRSKAALTVYNILSNPGTSRGFCYLSHPSLSLLPKILS